VIRSSNNKSKRHYKFIFLILSSDKYPSYLNEKAQYKTWISDLEDDSLAIFYKGGNKFEYINNYLTLETGSSLGDIGYKTIASFEWLKKHYTFDYIVRPSSSTYINLKELKKHISENASSKPFYSGRSTIYDNTFEYAHGSCIMLDNTAVDIILKNQNSWDHTLIDDAALGKLCGLLDIKLIPKEVLHVDSKILKGELDKNEIAYRCKMELSGYPRFLDRYFIQLVHDNLNDIYNKNTVLLYRIIFNLIKFFNLKYIYLQYNSKIYYKITSYFPSSFKNFIKKLLKTKSS
jgi:hypothetical protein